MCFQLWSQWNVAMALLAVGGAALVCGTAWALVVYGEKVADDLTRKNKIDTESLSEPISCDSCSTASLDVIQRIMLLRRFLIFLGGGLSAVGIGTAIIMLVIANLLYIKAVRRVNINFDLYGDWCYLVFIVFVVGLYVLCRVTYLVFTRTVSAATGNIVACRKKREEVEHGPSPVMHKKDPYTSCFFLDSLCLLLEKIVMYPVRVMRRALVLLIVALLSGLGTELARRMGNYTVHKQAESDQKAAVHASMDVQLVPSWWIDVKIVGVVVLAVVAFLVLGRACGCIYRLCRRRYKGGNKQSHGLGNKKSHGLGAGKGHQPIKDTIQIRYDFGRPFSATYHIVGLAILSIIVAAIFTQGDLWQDGRGIGLAIFVGGVYPVGTLLGLSYSVAACEDEEFKGVPIPVNSSCWTQLPIVKQLRLAYLIAEVKVEVGDETAAYGLAKIPSWKEWPIINQVIP